MKYIFFFISLFLHLSFFVFIFPTIDKKSTPVIVSWLDVLSSSDLVSKKKENRIINHKIYTWFSKVKSEDYFFKKNSIALFRSYFLSIYKFPLFLSIKAVPEKNKKISKNLIHSKYFLLSLEKPTFLEKKEKILNLKYRIDTDKEGRILFFVPQILDNDLMLLYTNVHLRHNFLFLKKRNLFWTKIKIVIK